MRKRTLSAETSSQSPSWKWTSSIGGGARVRGPGLCAREGIGLGERLGRGDPARLGDLGRKGASAAGVLGGDRTLRCSAPFNSASALSIGLLGGCSGLGMSEKLGLKGVSGEEGQVSDMLS